jgi:hypothetical protein
MSLRLLIKTHTACTTVRSSAAFPDRQRSGHQREGRRQQGRDGIPRSGEAGQYGSASDRRRRPSSETDRTRGERPGLQVVGVVRDVSGIEFDGSVTRIVYQPMRSARFEGYPIIVRTQSDPALVIGSIDPLLSSIDPNILGSSRAFRSSAFHCC